MSTEEEKIDPHQAISALSIAQFIGIMSGVLAQRDEQKHSKGESKLLEMTAQEFTEQMVNALKGRALQNGVLEQAVADRVLQDWRTIEEVNSVTMPFRVKNATDVHRMAQSMAQTFSPGFTGELIVVVAIAHSSGQVEALRGS